jgi:hypothetical protein
MEVTQAKIAHRPRSCFDGFMRDILIIWAFANMLGQTAYAFFGSRKSIKAKLGFN